MSGDQSESGAPTTIDHAAAFADIRQRLSSLDDSIVALRAEADRLNESAAGRVTLAVLEPPAEPIAETDDALDDMAALSDSIEALGRHAANVPEDFDPRPYDPEADDADEAPLDAGRHGIDAATEGSDDSEDAGAMAPAAGAFDDLAAAPAFEPTGSSVDASLPAFDASGGATTFEEREPEAVISPQAPPPPPTEEDEVEDDGPGATVLEFTPRSLTDPSADASAFGAIESTEDDDTTSELEPPTELNPVETDTESDTESGPETDPADAPAFGQIPGVEPRKAKARTGRSRWGSRDDGLDAIADSESTAVPKDWDEADPGDDAFDKFFSSDVEPEPAQRWLLNE